VQQHIKTSDLTAKDQQLVISTDNVETLTQERNKVKEQLDQLKLIKTNRNEIRIKIVSLLFLLILWKIK
jgi:hypothetical protein